MHTDHGSIPRKRSFDRRPAEAAAAHILDRAFHDDPRVAPYINSATMDADWEGILADRWPLTNDSQHCDNWAHHFNTSEWFLLETVANVLGEGTDYDLVDSLPMLTPAHYNLVFEALAAARAAGSV